MLQPLARLLWDSAEAEIVDMRFVERGSFQSGEGGRTGFEVWEYMLDVAAPDGQEARMTVQEKSFWLPHGTEVGDRIPVLVNGKRDKIEIDRKAISDAKDAEVEARDAVQKARDEARFKARMEGRSEEASSREAREAEDEALRGLGDTRSAAAVREDLEIDRELEDQMKADEEFLRKHSGD